MFTNSAGVSFYKSNGKYYRNSGWLEVEISKEEYEKGINEVLTVNYPKYVPGEAVIYQNGDRYELGIVKTVCDGGKSDEYFINYHTGDTAARTHARHLHKICNGYAFHVIRLDTDDNERR